MLGRYIMGSSDKIKVKDLAWIQRLEIELDVPDSQAIQKNRANY